MYVCATTLFSHSRVDSLQRLRGYTYTCRLRDGTLRLVTPVWGRAPLYSGFFFALPFLEPSVVAAVGGGLTVIRPFCRETCEGVPRDRSGTPRQSGCSTLNLAVSTCSSRNLVLLGDEESIRHQKDGAGLPWCWPHAPAAMRGPLSADSMLRRGGCRRAGGGFAAVCS